MFGTRGYCFMIALSASLGLPSAFGRSECNVLENVSIWRVYGCLWVVGTAFASCRLVQHYAAGDYIYTPRSEIQHGNCKLLALDHTPYVASEDLPCYGTGR